jgi:hypothetical protein
LVSQPKTKLCKIFLDLDQEPRIKIKFFIELLAHNMFDPTIIIHVRFRPETFPTSTEHIRLYPLDGLDGNLTIRILDYYRVQFSPRNLVARFGQVCQDSISKLEALEIGPLSCCIV